MDEVTAQRNAAPYYQRRYTGQGRRYHASLVQRLLQEAAYGDHVLDAGCGTGFAWDCAGDDYQILGIDLSAEMLAYHRGPHQWMDVTKLQFPDASFDFLLCRSLLHHLPDPAAGLAEMARVLKPGGRAAFLETNKSAIATQVRKRTQHGDRFSEFHTSFTAHELRTLIEERFLIHRVEYEGFLRYPLLGFPDIINFERWLPFPPFWYTTTGLVDTLLARIPWIQRLSWATLVYAQKP